MTGKCITLTAFRHGFTENTVGRNKETADKKKKSGGIKIICQSEARDFSAMAFITDHVNSLIDQWFPGKRTAVIFCVVLCLYNRKFFSKALQVHNTVC